MLWFCGTATVGPCAHLSSFSSGCERFRPAGRASTSSSESVPTAARYGMLVREQLVSVCWVFHLLAHLQIRIRTSVRFSPSPWKWPPRRPGTEDGGGAGRAGKCGTPWGERPTEGRRLRRRSRRTASAWTWEQPPVPRGDPYLCAGAQRPTAVHGAPPLLPIAPSPPASAVVLPVAVWGRELCSNWSNQIWLSGI